MPGKLGDRVKFHSKGTAHYGRVLKENRKTFLVSDEKWGSTDTYLVPKDMCNVLIAAEQFEEHGKGKTNGDR